MNPWSQPSSDTAVTGYLGAPRRLESAEARQAFVLETLAWLKERETPKNVEMLRDTGVPPDACGRRSVPQGVALAWLSKTHGASLGDVVCVGGWAVPRDILIEKFSIDENREGDFFMWFSGPTAYPKGTERRDNGTPAYSFVRRVTSKRIDRFVSQERADLASRSTPAPAPAVVRPPAPPVPPAKVYPPAQRTDILARVRAAQQAGDQELQARISLEWLDAVHGVRPGDYVRVPMYQGGTRVVFLTGAHHCGLSRPAGDGQVIVIEGPCEYQGKAWHYPSVFHLTGSICKVDEGEATPRLKDFVRKSRAKNVVAARSRAAA